MEPYEPYISAKKRIGKNESVKIKILILILDGLNNVLNLQNLDKRLLMTLRKINELQNKTYLT